MEERLCLARNISVPYSADSEYQWLCPEECPDDNVLLLCRHIPKEFSIVISWHAEYDSLII